MGVGQALSVPIVDPSRYQTPLMGAVGTRKGMSGTLSWVLWWFGSYTSAGLPVVRVERDFSGTYHTISIFHIFYHLCSKYYHLPTFTHHVYLRVGDIERSWLTRSVVSNTLIHFDFYTFLADIRTTIHTGAILLASILYYYMWMLVWMIWRNEKATDKHNSGPLSLLVLMPNKDLIQAGIISLCVNLFISRSWSLNKPYYLWSHQQILTLVLRVLLVLDCWSIHVYLREGDIERSWLTRSVVSDTLIHFDFYTFLVDARTTIHIGAILLASTLYCYMWIFVLISLYGVLVHLHTFTHYFSHLYLSVSDASWLIWLLCMDTMETTLSDQFLHLIV